MAWYWAMLLGMLDKCFHPDRMAHGITAMVFAVELCRDPHVEPRWRVAT